MIRRPDELTESIRSAVNHRAVLFSHILLAVVIAAHTALDPTSTQLEINVAVILSALLVVLILLRVFDMAQINSRPLLYIVAYQIFTFVGIGFISDAATPYIAGLYLVVFVSNLYYGSRGVWITVWVFAATTITKYIYMSQTENVTVSDKLNILVSFFVFAAVCSVFVNYQKVFDWDRARLRESIKKEVIEQKRLKALINNMTESVVVLDKEGTIRLYNASALALFNTNQNLVDRPLDEFIDLEDEKGKKIITKDLLPPGNIPLIRGDILLRYSPDDVAALSLVVTPIRPNFGYDDNEAGYIVTLRDITREKSLEEERNEFISVISHELRTPVTVVEAGVSNSLMLAEKVPNNQKIIDSLKAAHDEALYLASMLNDLSTFARAEKGTLDLELEKFDPRDVLEHLKYDYQSSAEVKDLSLRIVIDPSTPSQIVSNRLYVREIMQNFVTNAIKYSNKGTITLSSRGKDNGVLFSVADEGIGISVSDQKKVYDKFFRAEDFRTRSTSGTGLGLYIAQKLAKILDASFDLKSEVGKGSTFSAFIPDKSELLAAKHTTATKQVPTNAE